MPVPLPNVRAALHLQQQDEVEDVLQAIRQGEIDAVVVEGESGPQVYTLLNADRPYRTIVERMQEGVLTLTPDGTVLFANQRLASFLGLALPEIVGQKFGQFVAADDRTLFDDLLAGGGQPDDRSELMLCAADGAAVPVYLSMIDLTNEGQKIISALVTDLRWQKESMRELAEANAKLVTVMLEWEQTEARLRQAHKMEAVGQLTAGIAHDFNNLLSVIAGNLELFRRGTSDEALKSRVEAGQRAVERGAQLTQQLLAFSRVQSLRPQVISVDALLLDIESLLRSYVGDEITLTLALGTASVRCLVDSTELQAAILNLAANARDAMPDGGSLTIATAEAEFDGQPDGGTGGHHLSIVVTDTGHGMPPEIRERAFDPFFTTKDVGAGTGLGLSRVYGFMQQSGGHVTIESAPGAGTSVRLYLPSTDASASAPDPYAAIPVPPCAPQDRCVLVVEDDPDVRDLVIEFLQSSGYTTIAAASGVEALSLLNSGTAVDIIISDVLMPGGISGFQLAREIRARLPHVAIVLTSGMTGGRGGAEHATQEMPVLRKPYKCDDLMRAIEAALAASSQRP
jgi:PAS domain S-box-containing protein